MTKNFHIFFCVHQQNLVHQIDRFHREDRESHWIVRLVLTSIMLSPFYLDLLQLYINLMKMDFDDQTLSYLRNETL